MQLELPDELLDQLGAAIARHIAAPPDLELLDITALSKESGLSVTALKEACRCYEAGNPNGLRCTRDTPGVPNSTLRVAREWFLAWREVRADANQLRQPIRLGKAAA